MKIKFPCFNKLGNSYFVKNFFSVLICCILILQCFFRLSYASDFESKFDRTNQCSNKDYIQKIRELWNKKKTDYYKLMKNGHQKGRSYPYILYDIQTLTHNLLRYSAECNDFYMLEELVLLYTNAINNLVETDSYTFYYYPNNQIKSIQKLKKKHKMWLNNELPVVEEVILCSSQFLYLISDAIVIVANIKKENQTPIMRDFITRFLPILLDHYQRWIFDEKGSFQVKGWGCKYQGEYVKTSMNHYEFITKKTKRELGDNKSPGYCNAVTDTDIFIIAGVSNILSANTKDSNLIKIDQNVKNLFLEYLKEGILLLKSRISYHKIKDFDGNLVEASNFDLGVWDYHPDYAYSNYTSKVYPDIKNSEYRATNVGWDLSHARRFVHIFESLYRNAKTLKLDFPDYEFMKKLSNQFIYGTFNRDFKKPLFTNFMNGTNGWYRVGYSNRKGFGYGPFDMSIAVLTGGYGFLSKYNNDIERVFCALIKMIESKNPDIREHVIEHYENNVWKDYKHYRSFDFHNKDNPNTQAVLLQFLPSLYNMRLDESCLIIGDR